MSKKLTIIRNVRTASKEEMEKRDGAYQFDEIRQDYQKSSDRDRLAHEKAVREGRR